MPLVARTGQPTPDLVGEGLAELARPLAHGLMAHVDAAGGQHLCDHAQAQGKAEVEPDGVADDLAWKAVAGVGGLGGRCHAGPLPVPTLSAKPRPKLTVPVGLCIGSWLLSASGVVGLAHATRPATRALSRALHAGARCARTGRSRDRAAACLARCPGAGGARSAARTRTLPWC